MIEILFSLLLEQPRPTPDPSADYCAGGELCGTLDSALLSEFDDQLIRDGRLSVASPGGDARAAARLALLLDARNVRVQIHGVCASACLETFAPALGRVEFVDAPLVLSHGGVEMRAEIRTRAGLPQCRNDLEAFRALSKATFLARVDDGIGAVHFEKFGVHDLNTAPGASPCEEVLWSRTVDYWAPNSEELTRYYGIEADGPVAGDDPDYAIALASCLFQDGTRFLVGETIYLSSHRLCDAR